MATTMRDFMEAANQDEHLEIMEAALLQARNAATHLQRMIRIYQERGNVHKFLQSTAAEQLEKAAELTRTIK